MFQAWAPPFSRLTYVYTSLVLQYILPSMVVAGAYLSVYTVLRNSTNKMTRESSKPRMLRQIHRRKKTNIILTLISFVFFISWAPLNILNVIINIYNPFHTEESLVTMFGICHIVGMSSACTNPILYGLINTNFRKVSWRTFGMNRGFDCVFSPDC